MSQACKRSFGRLQAPAFNAGVHDFPYCYSSLQHPRSSRIFLLSSCHCPSLPVLLSNVPNTPVPTTMTSAVRVPRRREEFMCTFSTVCFCSSKRIHGLFGYALSNSHNTPLQLYNSSIGRAFILTQANSVIYQEINTGSGKSHPVPGGGMKATRARTHYLP